VTPKVPPIYRNFQSSQSLAKRADKLSINIEPKRSVVAAHTPNAIKASSKARRRQLWHTLKCFICPRRCRLCICIVQLVATSVGRTLVTTD